MDLSNREIATLVWFAALVATPFLIPKVRSSALAVLRLLFQRIFIIVFGIAATYAAGCVALLAWLGVWTPDNLKTTIWWAATVGFVSMFDINRIDEDGTYFRKTIRDTISVTVILIFIVEFHTFPLLAELALVPFLAFLALLLAFADKPEHAIVDRFLTNVMALIGLGLLSYSAYQTLRHWAEFATIDTIREFLLPILLTLMFLPFLYAMSVYVVYEQVFGGLNFAIRDDQLRRFAKRQALMRFRFNLDLLKRWRRMMVQERPDTRDAIRQSLRDVKALHQKEQSPQPVSPDEGWSPFLATSFLVEEGVMPGDYHRQHDDVWHASSKFLKIEQGALANSIVYYVDGDENAAKQLTLELLVHHVNERDEADARFQAVAEALLRKAIGDDAARLLPFPLDDFETVQADRRVRLETESWTINQFESYQRTLTIGHPSYSPPSPSF